MNTDRRIYFTTAIIALVVIFAISFLAQSDPIVALRSPAPADGRGIVVREAQSTSTEAVEAIGVRAPSSRLDFEPVQTDVVRLARANPAL